MIKKDFFLALEDLEREKGINQDVFIEALEGALALAYKKHSGDAGAVQVKLNADKSEIRIFSYKRIVEEVVDRDKEISLEEAREIKKSYKAGDVISNEINPKNFGRIAAQTAKQVILQKLRETERSNVISSFSDKEGELISCVIRRIDNKNIYIEMGGGNNQVEGLLMPSEQVEGEKYALNSRLKVYVKRVKNTGKVAQVLVSRSSGMLIKKLFENEVPEIARGLVSIKSISREAGQRTKIAVHSEDGKIDAVGACVGNKGARVNAVVSEINGEKIDIVLYSENPLEYIARALSPAPVLKVYEMEEEKSALVIVPDDKLSLAIGKDGQNARLAARLTGWKIDVKSKSTMDKLEAEQQAEEESSETEQSLEAEQNGGEINEDINIETENFLDDDTNDNA